MLLPGTKGENMQICQTRRGGRLSARQGLSPLALENARLRRLCALTKEIVDRHALALREADHRIKNSLQIVSSGLGLQARRETNTVARAALQTAAARINAVARIHDALQLSQSTGEMDLGRTVEIMCQSLDELGGPESGVRIVAQVQPVMTSMEIAQPVVIAINELVINALRHAFPDERNGEVVVEVSQIGVDLHVSVADNGIGLPPAYQDGKGYGISLVRMLTSKLGGALNVECGSGSRFTLSAPLRI